MDTEKSRKLTEFKERIKDARRPSHGDPELEKWLIARRYDLKEAEKMYRAHMSWRRVFKADEILETFQLPEVIDKFYPGGLCGYDSELRPISIDPLGKLDLKGMMKSATTDEILHAMAWRFETLEVEFRRLSEKHGRPINQVTQILDFEGFGRQMLYVPGAELFINILKMNDSNYPETLYKSYIVNTPYLFQLGYSFIKRFLSEDTKKKFCFMGSNWKRELREAIGSDQYPVHWGGTLTDPDGNEYCQSKVCLGGSIPETYYREDLKEEREVHLKTAQVKSGDVFQVKVNVEKDSLLQWYFITEGKDIEFAVKYKSECGKEEMVEAARTVTSHKIPESGSCLCEKAGMYTVIFDNTKSWVSNKTVKYNIGVITQDQAEGGVISTNL